MLESAASLGYEQLTTKLNINDTRPNLLVFSANHAESLRRSVQNHESYLSSNPDSLNDLSYSLSTRRQPLSLRAYCVASEGDPLELSRINKATETPNLVFTFTGQGAQWARMGRELFSKEPAFADTIGALDKFLSLLPNPPQWSLRGNTAL